MSKFKPKYRWRKRKDHFRKLDAINNFYAEIRKGLELGLSNKPNEAKHYTTSGIYNFIVGKDKGCCLN